ncbi:MAG TPA: CPBP family glutamic-type intramembrane protease [Candidatus Binataceae bacterium]
MDTRFVVYICWVIVLATISVLLFPAMLLWERTDTGSELERMTCYGFPPLAREFPVLTELGVLALLGIIMPRICFRFGYPAAVSAVLYATVAYGYLLQPPQPAGEHTGLRYTAAAPPPTKLQRSSLPIATLVGLAIALLFPITPFRQPFLYLMVAYGRVSWITAWASIGTVFNLAAVVAILFILIRWERRPLNSIGWRTPRLIDLVFGVAGFVAIQQATLMTWGIMLRVMPSVAADTRAVAILSSNLPLAVDLLASISSAVAEEVGFRGYALERLSEITGSLWIGAGIPYVIEVLCHAPIWGLRGMLLKAPPLLILVLLYLWRRSLPACILAHLLVDVIPVFW